MHEFVIKDEELLNQWCFFFNINVLKHLMTNLLIHQFQTVRVFLQQWCYSSGDKIKIMSSLVFCRMKDELRW